MKSMIDAQIEQSLLARDEARKDRVRSGLYNPSSFGRCYRLQYWNRKDEPVTNPPGIDSLENMTRGVNSHFLVQQHFPKEQTELEIIDTLYGVKGYADIVTDDTVYDLKFTEIFGYKYWDVPTAKILERKKHSCLQVVYYAMALDKTYAILRAGKYGSLRGVEHSVMNVDTILEVQDELNTIKNYWDRQVLPPAEPRAFNGRGCSYCSWKDKCKEMEKKKGGK